MLGLTSIILPTLVESGGWMVRNARCRLLYRLAMARAHEAQKPLVVVGSPGLGPSGARGGAYTCGDICVDLGGCPRCGAPPRDLTKRGGIPVADGGAVVFVCYVLEYVGNFPAAWLEVARACGEPKKNAFVAYVQPWATWTRIGTGCNWIVESAPPELDPGGSGEVMAEPLYRSARRERYEPVFVVR